MTDHRRDHGRRRAHQRRVHERGSRAGGDGVLVALLKAAAYSQAPRLTFGVLHPKQAAQLKKLPFDLRTAYAPRLVAVLAAALALPAGVAIGRALERRAQARPTPARRTTGLGDVPGPQPDPRDPRPR